MTSDGLDVFHSFATLWLLIFASLGLSVLAVLVSLFRQRRSHPPAAHAAGEDVIS
jgi:hypothetical protein